MVVTCLAIGDPHFQTNNVKDSDELIDKVTTLIRTFKPTFVVILGDLLHTHEKIHVTPFNQATKFINSIAELVPLYVIIGNHDLINCQQFLTDQHAFNAFKDKDNIVICDKPIIDYYDDLKFVFCPYVPPDSFESALNTLEDDGENWQDATCIFAHQEFYGCSYNPTTKSVEGDIWPEEYPLVVSGHIHNEQRLQENIYYPGSSMQHAFGESENKIIALLTFGKVFSIKRIDLELTKKKIIYMDINKVDNFIGDKNVFTKLVLKGTPEEFRAFRRSTKYKELKQEQVLVSFLPQITTLTSGVKGERQNIMTIFNQLIENENLQVKNLAKELFS